jgi:hypothetical protein
MKKVRAEVDAAAAKGELSAIPQYAETQQLPYLQACVSGACNALLNLMLT